MKVSLLLPKLLVEDGLHHQTASLAQSTTCSSGKFCLEAASGVKARVGLAVETFFAVAVHKGLVCVYVNLAISSKIDIVAWLLENGKGNGLHA